MQCIDQQREIQSSTATEIMNWVKRYASRVLIVIDGFDEFFGATTLLRAANGVISIRDCSSHLDDPRTIESKISFFKRPGIASVA